MDAVGRRLALTGVVICVLLGIVAEGATASPCPEADTAAAELVDFQMENSLLCLINQTRVAAGRRPVRPSPNLNRAAGSYSAWMVLGGYFSHRGAAGSTVASRLRFWGYVRPRWHWAVGENLIWAGEAESSPEELVELWMKSPEHRANLLRPVFRDVGVGVRHGTPVDPRSSAGVTVTTEFGAHVR